MGKNEDPNLQQREQSSESESNQEQNGFCCGRSRLFFSRISKEFSFRCVFVLFLSLSVLLPGIFWIRPFRSLKSGFDAKQAIKLSTPVHAYFKLQKPVSELVQYIGKLEYDIYEEIGVPDTKVAILSMHQSGASNYTDVVLGVLSDPMNAPMNPVSLSVLRSSLIELFLRQSNLTLTTPIFGQPSKFEILKFPGGITIIPTQSGSIFQTTQILFNFTLNNSIAEIQENFIELKDQLRYGLGLRSYENILLQLTNKNGSTMSSPIIVQAAVMSDFGSILPQRSKQLAQTITESPARNLGLNNTVFGKVKSISLSSYLKGTLHGTPPTPSPAPSPGPSASQHPNFPPAHSPALSPKSHHPPTCRKCKPNSPSHHRPRHSPSPRSGPHPSFPPSISPAPSTKETHPPPPVNTLVLRFPQVSYRSRPGQGEETTKGPVSAPLAQSPSAPSPSSLAVCVHAKEAWMVEAPMASFEVFAFSSGNHVHVNEMEDELVVKARKVAGHSSYFERLSYHDKNAGMFFPKGKLLEMV
ncbi:hypothetical protein CCACVL1_16189 [Corchorus capsularis]|uniref:DUF7036 domain-containing protein n=1 Tax=Corchorus capsularis TaxID=210143 RepID=A0A1R3HYF2_COCAP|nr:hypothetical protein CCACVL1_16189 [Corchorus capsularis]